VVSRNRKSNSMSNKGDSVKEKYTTKINNKYAVLGSADDKSDGLQRDHGLHSAGLNGGVGCGSEAYLCSRRAEWIEEYSRPERSNYHK